MEVNLLVEGGAMQPGPSLAQKVGPMGLNMGQIVQQVNDATKDFKGMKVPVVLDIDPNTKEVNVNVYSPPSSELLKKEFGIEKGSGIQKRFNTGNASIEQIISIAKTKLQNLLDKDLKSAVKSIIGTCGTLGILVENKRSLEAEKMVDEGKFDKEIKEEKTETPEEKRKQLDSYFKDLQNKQKARLEKEQQSEESK